MKISWALWYVITFFWIIIILGISIYSWFNGLSNGSNEDFYKFLWLLVGLFIIPIIIQLLWLFINILVKVFK
ncbi:hypothetical protein ACWEYS_13380 [Staphylococcus xylosus]